MSQSACSVVCLCGSMNAACSSVCFRCTCGVCDHVRTSVYSCCMCQKAKTNTVCQQCLPAAPVIDVDGNTQTAAEELLTHERQTRWLDLSYDGQISNSTLESIDGFIYSSFNFFFAFKAWLRISYLCLQPTAVVVLIGLLLSHFVMRFWFLISLFKRCNYILLKVLHN